MDRPCLVVFRYKGAVLGYEHVLPSELPLTTAEHARLAARAVAPSVAELLHLGGDNGELLPRWMEPEPLDRKDALFKRLDAALAERRSRPITLSASIVICTLGRPADLAECLAAIEAERVAGREIVVVDNGPDAETEAVARAVGGVRYVVEPRRGLNNARNTGLRAATGDVVVYVDDDVRPEPGWVDALLRRFDKPEVGIVCGLVLPEALETEGQIGFQYDLGFGGMGMKPIAFGRSFLKLWPWSPPVWDIGAGANMAVRRDMALAIGGFDGRVGAGVTGGGGDDTEFWHNLLLHGGEARYEPLAVVRHRHRRTMRELKRQAYVYGHGHVVSLFATFAQSREASHLLRAFIFLPLWYARRTAAAPSRWLWGDPDRLLVPSILGYLASFRHIRLAWAERPVRGEAAGAAPFAAPEVQERRPLSSA
ncbi:MAG: glycosyltransferase [Hyphomonadaceae bacterium]